MRDLNQPFCGSMRSRKNCVTCDGFMMRRKSSEGGVIISVATSAPAISSEALTEWRSNSFSALPKERLSRAPVMSTE